MPSNRSRRQFLAAGAGLAATAASGCLGALGTDESATRKLRLTVTPVDGSLRDRHVVDLERTRQPWDEEAFAAAVNGSTYTTQVKQPFYAREGDPKYAERNGTYYRLGSVVVDEREATHPVLRLFEVGRTDELDSPPEYVERETLPQVDRVAVQIAYKAARARGNEGGVPWGLVQRGGYVYGSQEAVEESRLLAESGPSHVEHRDTVYEVAVSRETFHEPVYRADVEPVADTPERMEAILRARLVDARFDREDLSEETYSVFRNAFGQDGHAETHPYSSAFQSLLKHLHRRAYLDGNVEKDAFTEDHERGLLLVDGEYYEFRLRFVTTGD
ncbi:hypothetical protein ACFQH6_12355 [Halobacteriaceae archaeon GCM10025711]